MKEGQKTEEDFTINFAVTPFFETGIPGMEFIFTADLSEGYTDYMFDWDFGDGTTTSGSSPRQTHTYDEPKKYYDVTLEATASDRAGNRVIATSPTKQILVIAPPTGPKSLGVKATALKRLPLRGQITNKFSTKNEKEAVSRKKKKLN
jgi:hypothetical protein